jgi:hypothetical protein
VISAPIPNANRSGAAQARDFLSRRWIELSVGLYLGLRVWSFAGVAGHASSFPDTFDYEQTAGKPLWSLEFWTWFKPWGTPLLWKLLPGTTSTVAPIAQWLISVAAWLALAAAVYRTLERRAVKRGGLVLVLGLSLVPAVAVWDGALLSESLNLSLAALLVAAMLMLLHEPGWLWAVGAIAAALLLAGTRATNGYLAPFLLLPTAAAIAGQTRRIALVVAAAALVIAALAYSTSNVRQWQVPLGEIVAGRVLRNPGELRYFQQRGMPLTPTLARDIYANRSPLERFEAAPALQAFLPWFNSRARGVYFDYLVSHPSSTLGDPIRDLPGMVSPSSSLTDLQALPLRIYAAKGYRDALPGTLDRVLYPSNAGLLLGWAIAVAALAVALFELRRRTWLVSTVLIASTLPHAVVIWTGDDASIGRHALLLAVYLRLALILLSVQLLDAYLVDRREAARQLEVEPAGSGVSTGSSALHGNTIQQSVRLQTYSHWTTERGFS